MDSSEMWFAGAGFAITILGGVVTYAIGYGKVSAAIDGVIADVDELKAIPNRVLVLETEQKHTVDSMDEIKQSLNSLAKDVRESNHRIRNDLQATNSSLEKMGVHLENIQKFIDREQKKLGS